MKKTILALCAAVALMFAANPASAQTNIVLDANGGWLPDFKYSSHDSNGIWFVWDIPDYYIGDPYPGSTAYSMLIIAQNASQFHFTHYLIHYLGETHVVGGDYGWWYGYLRRNPDVTEAFSITINDIEHGGPVTISFPPL